MNHWECSDWFTHTKKQIMVQTNPIMFHNFCVKHENLEFFFITKTMNNAQHSFKLILKSLCRLPHIVGGHQAELRHWEHHQKETDTILTIKVCINFKMDFSETAILRKESRNWQFSKSILVQEKVDQKLEQSTKFFLTNVKLVKQSELLWSAERRSGTHFSNKKFQLINKIWTAMYD